MKTLRSPLSALRFSLLALCSLLFASVAQSATLILHEKLAGNVWVLARTIVTEGQSVAAAIQAIEDDPARRMGQAFAAVGGAWLQLEEIPGAANWEPQPASGFYVFWSVTNSTDPADFHAERFDSLAEAQAFINEIQGDATRTLWDQRPFEISTIYQPATQTSPSRWIIK